MSRYQLKNCNEYNIRRNCVAVQKPHLTFPDPPLFKD